MANKPFEFEIDLVKSSDGLYASEVRGAVLVALCIYRHTTFAGTGAVLHGVQEGLGACGITYEVARRAGASCDQLEAIWPAYHAWYEYMHKNDDNE